MDKTTTTLCANLCILSYQNKGEHMTDIFDSEISTMQEFVCENAKGFGIKCENTLYICWTGTNDIIDIYDDFQFTTKVPLLLDEKQYG